MKKRSNIPTPNADAEKMCLNLVLAVFELYIIDQHTPAQRRALVQAWQIVARKARNPHHTAQLIRFLDEEMAQDKIPVSKQGTYLLRRVRSKPLPKVPKSYNPLVHEL